MPLEKQVFLSGPAPTEYENFPWTPPAEPRLMIPGKREFRNFGKSFLAFLDNTKRQPFNRSCRQKALTPEIKKMKRRSKSSNSAMLPSGQIVRTFQVVGPNTKVSAPLGAALTKELWPNLQVFADVIPLITNMRQITRALKLYRLQLKRARRIASRASTPICQ